MTEERNQLQKLVGDILDTFAARLAASNQPMTAETLSEMLVEYVTRPEFMNDDMRSRLITAVRPFVQAWLDGRA